MPPRSTLQKLSVICLVSFTVPSSNALSSAIDAAQALGILQRDTGSCANSTFSHCSDAKLPSNFCCPPSTTCISLDDSSTALCCPGGGNNCQSIKPITCDISQQNVTAHLNGPVFTTKLNEPLIQCGTACCPHGYSCSSGGCVANKQISSSTSSAATSSTPAITLSTSSSAPTSTPPDAPSSSNSTGNATSSHCSKFPAAAVVAGFFPGLILGVLATLAGIVLLGHRSSSRPSSSSSKDTKISHLRTRSGDSYRGGILGVSDPITDPQKSARTDFLRRDPSGPPPTPPQQLAINRALSRTGQKVRSLFRPNNVGGYEEYPMSPVTPPQRNYMQEHTPPRPGMQGLNREPSTESIKVYSPAYLARQERPPTAQSRLGIGQGNATRPQTTFTEMMERVGFTNGKGGTPRYNVQNPGGTPRRER